jgi:O-acetylhomoserine (thiol)-lyase
MGPAAYIARVRTVMLRNTGAALSPFNAFLILQGLETMALRVERQSQNALTIAKHLESHPDVSWVYYPGLEGDDYHEVAKRILNTGKGYGGIVSFGVKSGRDGGRAFIEALELFTHLANIGDARSLAIHNASTTHSQLNDAELETAGVKPDMVRLSVGIENVDDLIADIDQALAKSK